MNKELGFSLLLLLLSVTLMSQDAKKSTFNITGNITGLNDDSVYIFIGPKSGKRVFDTLATKAASNRFHFNGTSSTTERVMMALGDVKSHRNAYFYVEPGEISISGVVDSLDELSITGTITNNEYTNNQLHLAPLYRRRSLLGKEYRKIYPQEGQEAEILLKEIDRVSDSIDRFKVKFMEEHPDSKISIEYLYVLQDHLSIEDVERIYSNFSARVKKSQDAKYVYSKLQTDKKVAVGKKALPFMAKDTNGKMVNLNDFKGKYVLLEFWAHWCVPCRAQSPHLVKIFDKFKDKGFTILQYSLDVKKDEQKWKNAIEEDGLVWTHIANIEGSGTNVARLYGVQPIPDNFLISPDGTILGRRLTSKELEKRLEELLHTD